MTSEEERTVPRGRSLLRSEVHHLASMSPLMPHDAAESSLPLIGRLPRQTASAFQSGGIRKAAGCRLERTSEQTPMVEQWRKLF